jgi:hypothetical protein
MELTEMLEHDYDRQPRQVQYLCVAQNCRHNTQYTHVSHFSEKLQIKQNKLRRLSPLANYTDRATAACRRS